VFDVVMLDVEKGRERKGEEGTRETGQEEGKQGKELGTRGFGNSWRIRGKL